MTLYEIDAQIKATLDRMLETVDEETGEVAVDPAELEQLQAAREQKLENIALYIKNLDADAVAMKAEENNLKERRQAAERKAERLRSLLSMSMLQAGEDKFTTARCAVSFRRSEVVNVLDLDMLDAEYVVEKKEYSADKKKLKEALKAGLDITGAVLEEKQNIQIK